MTYEEALAARDAAEEALRIAKEQYEIAFAEKQKADPQKFSKLYIRVVLREFAAADRVLTRAYSDLNIARQQVARLAG